MIIFGVIAAVVAVLLELFAVATAIMAKKCGDKNWKLALLPIYSFAVLQRLTGTFTVLTIPMKKYGQFVAVLAVTALIAGLLCLWSDTLPEPSRTALKQIMYLPLATTLLLFYLAALNASAKAYRRLSAKCYTLWCAVSVLLLPIPFIMIGLSGNTVKSLNDIY